MSFTNEEKMHFKLLGKRVGGRLECWAAQEDLFEGTVNVVGYSFGDDEWEDGECVTTSIIEKYELSTEYIITKNTVYELGKPSYSFTTEEKIKFNRASKLTRYS